MCSIIVLGSRHLLYLPRPRAMRATTATRNDAVWHLLRSATDKPPTTFYDEDHLCFAGLASPSPGSTPVGTTKNLASFRRRPCRYAVRCGDSGGTRRGVRAGPRGPLLALAPAA